MLPANIAPQPGSEGALTQTLGKYTLGELLGQGGMGAVYRSHHPLLNRSVAIKVMLASVADPQAHQRFLREAQVVAVLAHPHIVNIFDVDVQDGQPYIVMDFAPGGSLAARLQGASIGLDETLRMAIPLADALAYAHSQGLIHRDLKPANVLLRLDGSPVLADFGLARPISVDSAAQITATGTLMGTLAYMAPEQFSGRPADARTDIYAFGVMLYEMLTGRVPFEGDSAQIMYGHLQQLPAPPRRLNPALPNVIERLILRMLEKNPDLRPQSAAELAAELRVLQSAGAAIGPTVALTAQPAMQPETTAAARKNESRPRPHWPIALIVGVVIALAGIAAFRASQTAQRGDAPPPTARPTRSAIVIEQDPTPSAATELPAAPLIQENAALLTDAQGIGPESFSVGGISYKQNDDTLWFFGEVRNDGSAARESIELRVNLLDAAGKEIASTVGYASMSYLQPGETSPFSVLFTKDEAPPPFATYKIEVRSTKADFKLGYTYRDLSILPSPQARQDAYGFIKISGRVRNDGGQAAKFVQIYAVFYDQQGNVVGLANTFAEEANDAPLAAGSDARFEVQGIIFSGTPSRYRLFAEGSRAG
ncbi:MAG: protein kinase [Chloroflexota bacterium]|nr:protein kinase [Chloroflexota bacterium]